MKNPTYNELQASGKYYLVAELEHKQLRGFIIEQLMAGGKYARFFSIYQLLMLLLGLIFVTRALALALHGRYYPLCFTIGAILFSFTLLVAIHELLHGIALKLTGAKKVNYGGYLNSFIFYAEADRHVMNRKQFTLLALTPLVVVQALTLTGAIVYFRNNLFYVFVTVMSVHSFFCAGDIGMLAFFEQFGNEKVYTFDIKEERKAYFYKKIEP